MSRLPPFAPFPDSAWLSPGERETLESAWVAVSQAYLRLDDEALAEAADDSLVPFVYGFVQRGEGSARLRKEAFQLSSRLLGMKNPPARLLEHGFICGLARTFPRKHIAPLLTRSFTLFEASLASFKRDLVGNLEARNVKAVEGQLGQLNPLLHVSPETCVLFLAGSDFFDALVHCFIIMNPPLRSRILAALYLCLVGLPPKWAMLNDQLYALQSAAETHKKGPLGANDSLVADLVANTPLLRVLGAQAPDTIRNRLDALQTYKSGVLIRPRPHAKRKPDARGERVAQVQDLFPDLNADFILEYLKQHGDNVEHVVATLLADGLPSQRRNVFDNDDLDRLATDAVAKISFGKDDVAEEPPTAPNKAAIFSALAAFDADDDERDDTYDAADVGGTVDAEDDGNEEVLFRAYQSSAAVFGRDAETRRSEARASLKEETGMSDEALEGWAIMLARNPGQMKRLEARFAFRGEQNALEPSTEESDSSRRGGRGGRGRGRGGNDAASRRQKEAHKGSRANHHRRDAHAKKMARGGFSG